jgi:hypothetical protein
MSAGGLLAVTTVTVVVGQWAEEKPITSRIVVGGGILALGLAVMGESQPDLAGKFAVLIFVVAAFTYFPAIAYKFGIISSKPSLWGGTPK